MADENNEGQFITTASNLAEQLAKNRSFVSKIGLDDCPPDAVVINLERIFVFILEQYENAKDIFISNEALTLDEKLVKFIHHSCFMLMPWWAEKPSDAWDFSKRAYEHIKWHLNRSQRKWADISIYAKFFEICCYILLQKYKAVMRMLHEPKWDTGEDVKLVTRPVLSVAFEEVFSHMKWELDGTYVESEISSLKGIQKWQSKNTTDDWLVRPEFCLIYGIYEGLIHGGPDEWDFEFAKKRSEDEIANVFDQHLPTTPEEDFWINFILLTRPTVWKVESQVEISLIEILKLFLRIYRADINPEITIEGEAEFLALLNEKFYKAWRGFKSPWPFGELVLGRNANVYKLTLIEYKLLSQINALAGSVPFKLIFEHV